jgi:hypothetical protein
MPKADIEGAVVGGVAGKLVLIQCRRVKGGGHLHSALKPATAELIVDRLVPAL